MTDPPGGGGESGSRESDSRDSDSSESGYKAPGPGPQSRPQEVQVLIIGGGPGGISGALWAHRLGMDTLLLDGGDRLGGELRSLHGKVIDYPGIPVQKGFDLAPCFEQHLRSLEVPFRCNTLVRKVDGVHRTVTLESGEIIHFQALIVATGARRRRLDIPGESAWWGRGVSDSPTRDMAQACGRPVIVVGGGDAAAENALFLADQCPQVTLIHRGPTLRARPEFISKLDQCLRVTRKMSTRVTEIVGDDVLRGVWVESDGVFTWVPAPMVFIKIGVSPRVELLRDQVDIHSRGYLHVDRTQQTSREGIYAAGDNCSPEFSSIVNATCQGMVAARSIEARIRASREP